MAVLHLPATSQPFRCHPRRRSPRRRQPTHRCRPDALTTHRDQSPNSWPQEKSRQGDKELGGQGANRPPLSPASRSLGPACSMPSVASVVKSARPKIIVEFGHPFRYNDNCTDGQYNAWSMEHGAWSMEHGAWSMEHGAWSMEHGVRLDFSPRSPLPAPRSELPAPSSLLPPFFENSMFDGRRQTLVPGIVRSAPRRLCETLSDRARGPGSRTK